MGAFLTTIILLLLVVALLYIYLTWNFNHWKKRGVNGPKPIPLLGTLPNSLLQKRNQIFDYDEHFKKYKATDHIIGNFTIRTPELMILTPQLAKDIYVTQFHKFRDNYFATLFDLKREPILGLNPFLLKGQQWKEQRAQMTPAFTTSRVKASHPVMQKVAGRMIDYIKNTNKMEGSSYVFDCRDLTQRFTIQNVADAIYGVETNAFDPNGDSVLLDRARNLMNGLLRQFTLYLALGSIPLIRFLWIVKFLSKDTEDFLTNLMRKAIELRKSLKQEDRVDFLNYLIQLKEKKNLSDTDLQGLSITFFLDGFETSATVLAHTLMSLGRDKKIQNRLREEVRENVDENGNVTFEKLQEMPFLDQCLNETLRMYPPGAFAQKVCTEATELENIDGKMLPIEVGTIVTIPIYSLQHDENIFPNADVYDPDRFSPENGGERKYREMGAFLPFGDGPRRCLGQKFAYTQIKAAIVQIMSNFEIDVSDRTRKDIDFNPTYFLLYLDGGIWCSFTELEK